MMNIRLCMASLALIVFNAPVQAEEHANYHECLFDESSEARAEQAGQSVAVFCTSRHFDTVLTAFQAQVLMQDLEGMKQKQCDPEFKAFYDTVRKDSGNHIYTDRQIVLMYIDKREVNKD